MSIIARLGVILGLNSAEFTKGLDEATKKTKEFERNQKLAAKNATQATQDMIRTFGAATAAAGLLATAYIKVAQAAAQIVDESEALEMTIEGLLSAKAALQLAGGEANNFATMMNKLASQQDAAREGADSMREAFTRLGISGRDVDKLNLEELFKRVAFELSKVEDVTKRTALAQDMLGKAAKGVNWAEFVNRYKEFADPGLASAIRENDLALENIELTMKSISELTQKLIAPFSALLNMMFDLVKTYKELKQGADIDIDYGAAFGGMPGQEGATISHAGKGKAKSSASIAKPGQAGGYSQASEKEKAAAERKRKELEDRERRMVELIEKQQQKLAKFRNELEALNIVQERNIDNAVAGYEIDVKRLNLESQVFNLSKDAYESRKLYLEQNIRLLEIERQKTAELSKAREELERASPEDAAYAKQIYDKKIANIEQYYGLQTNLIKEVNKLEADNLNAMQERQYDFFAGFRKTMKDTADENAKIYKLGEEAFSSVMGNMDSALRNFVQTGKLQFKDFARSVISDLLMIAMKAQVISFFDALFLPKGTQTVGPLMKEDGGIVNWIKGTFSGRASGGAVSGAHLVGENGPELFMPSGPGTIIPNGSWQQMAARGGGMTVNGPYIANLSTIDSKSFEQRIYESNKAVWAAGKYAEKSLAVSGGRT